MLKQNREPATQERRRGMVRFMLCMGLGMYFGGASAQLPDVIKKIKPAVVGIGTYQELRQPRASLLGTGFVVGDGNYVVTNEHVLPVELDTENREILSIFLPGPKTKMRQAKPVASDPAHDLVLLRFEGSSLPALKLGDPGTVREGQRVAFTGFPIGAALGLFAATHRGMVSAIVPVVVPLRSGRELNAELIKRMREPYTVYQLDATAYPGNSGSPLYHTETGDIVGIINMVYVKEGRESALERPSGISYAVPVEHIHALLKRQR